MSLDDGLYGCGGSAYGIPGIGSTPSLPASAGPAQIGRFASRKRVASILFGPARRPTCATARAWKARTGETADAIGLGRLRLGLNLGSPPTPARRPSVPSA